jgi:hypothetical protein
MDTLLAPIAGAHHREVGGVTVDIVPAAYCRIKRAIRATSQRPQRLGRAP